MIHEKNRIWVETRAENFYVSRYEFAIYGFSWAVSLPLSSVGFLFPFSLEMEISAEMNLRFTLENFQKFNFAFSLVKRRKKKLLTSSVNFPTTEFANIVIVMLQGN